VGKNRGKKVTLWSTDPHCYWCGIETVLTGTNDPQPLPLNAATFDHVHPQSSRLRADHRSLGVLACRDCNEKRGSHAFDEFTIESVASRVGRDMRVVSRALLAAKSVDAIKTPSRWRGRRMFVNTLTSPFTQCHYCGQDLFWREKAADADIEIVWETRKTVWVSRRDGVRLREYRKGTVDHVVPISQNGRNHVENLVGCCESCNLAKGRQESAHCNRIATESARNRNRMT
jgi:5-methylcytosine-specific restriction endonuclease McrA